MRLWLASNNTNKQHEIASVLKNITILYPSDTGIAFNPDETGSSFLENALIKANTLFDLVQEPVVADDSGLCIDILNGKPDIFSSRYGIKDGVQMSYNERNELLLQEIADAEKKSNYKRPRTAHLICAMAVK
ncbi:hypothetical protein AGMMS49944_32100 [Spirochaetia bacterium]|nr:hypothetical protein AGMMS49944_32100 [Spirochaetia bacterium]